jgi:hypothetical protein
MDPEEMAVLKVLWWKLPYHFKTGLAQKLNHQAVYYKAA